MSTFTVNGKEYQAKPFDFNMVCELEDMGIRLESADAKQIGMVRAYFSICSGLSKEAAGAEIESHVIGGGKLDEIALVLSEELEKSDFFRALRESQEEKNPKSPTKKK